MGRIDHDVVGQREERAVEAVVELPGQRLGREAGRRDEVGPAHVADEEGVAGEDRDRPVPIDDEQRDALRRVSRRLEDAQAYAAERDLVAVAGGHVGEGGPGPVPDDDRRARAAGQLPVARHEVGVDVRLDDVADLEAVPRRRLQVGVDVPPGVDDRRDAAVADEVGGLRETAEVDLLEDHGAPPVGGGRLLFRRGACGASRWSRDAPLAERP